MMQMRFPLDTTPYAPDPRSRPIQPGLPDGTYVYVRDTQGVIHVVPDGPHLHPRVLGGGSAAMYAGDLTIQQGTIRDVTNLSGTFQFDNTDGLLAVADELIRLGFNVAPAAVRFFPMDGSRPRVLR
jgi:hypothetical protein